MVFWSAIDCRSLPRLLGEVLAKLVGRTVASSPELWILFRRSFFAISTGLGEIKRPDLLVTSSWASSDRAEQSEI
jgi:hypothetical protein